MRLNIQDEKILNILEELQGLANQRSPSGIARITRNALVSHIYLAVARLKAQQPSLNVIL